MDSVPLPFHRTPESDTVRAARHTDKGQTCVCVKNSNQLKNSNGQHFSHQRLGECHRDKAHHDFIVRMNATE